MKKMRKTHKIFFSNFLTLCIIFASTKLPTVASSNLWAGSKYQIECTMCSACDNPCNSPSPPPPSPPPPSDPSPPPPPPPSTSSSSNCPPPPSPPSYTYSSPPPPSQPTYSYPPPKSGGGGGGYYYPPAPPYKNFPAPGPPNPILPYFPFYYYNPPPQSMSESAHLAACPVVYTIALFLVSLLCFF